MSKVENAVISAEDMRIRLERVGLEPIRVNYLLADNDRDSFDLIRLRPTAFMGFINVLSNQYQEMAEFMVYAHAYLTQEYKNGNLDSKVKPEVGEYWWVEPFRKTLNEPRGDKKVIKVSSRNINTDLVFIKRVEEP